MKPIKDAIEQAKNSFFNAIKTCSSLQELEAIRITFLGRKGSIANLMSTFKTLSIEEKRTYGPRLQEFKTFAQQQYEQLVEKLKSETKAQAGAQAQTFDVTAYHPNRTAGSLHIYTQLIEKLENIFIGLGYQIADGLEVETEYYNFEALNIPKNHPARDLQDTFWLTTPNLLLRTHTSTVQIHAMEKSKAPFAVFAPGRVYRNEATDATHEFMFMQAECLYIDKNISLSHLLATAKIFLQKLFEKTNLDIRVRPGYFPFVEPGLEIDMQCPFCTDGCRVCKKTRWIELLGAGLVHPNVLQCSGINPQEYSGFAFGVGLERLAMIMHNINDIRLFHGNTIAFSDQF